jgi:hypothetical protein
MWERFELFWSAFEKFALFFAFIGTLLTLILIVFFLGTIARQEPPRATSTPTPTPTVTPLPTPPIEPVIEAVEEALKKIQDASTSVTVPISHTVPVTVDIRINPDQTTIQLVGTNDLRTGMIKINLDGAGELVGRSAGMELSQDNRFTVKMDLWHQEVIEVPVQVEVPIVVPSNVDLRKQIEDLEQARKGLGGGVGVGVPQAALGDP